MSGKDAGVVVLTGQLTSGAGVVAVGLLLDTRQFSNLNYTRGLTNFSYDDFYQ